MDGLECLAQKSVSDTIGNKIPTGSLDPDCEIVFENYIHGGSGGPVGEASDSGFQLKSRSHGLWDLVPCQALH